MTAVSLAGAVWWWIGVLALLLVVIPLVLILVRKVLADIREIDSYAADVLEHGVGITKNLEPVPALADTRELVLHAGEKLAGYVGTVDRLL